MQYLISDLFEKIILFENKTETATYTKISDEEYLVELEVTAKKFEADSVGRTKSVELTDWIDIGIYGEDEEGKDKLIYIRKHQIQQENNSFSMLVNQEPKKAGIDPINKLIDRNPDDNIKSISEKTESD